MQRVNMTKNSINEARQLLQKFAPQGESLAFINDEEARLLQAHGGSGELTKAGVPTYFIKNPFKKIGSKIKKTIKKIVPKELGQIASIAAMIPGPHQPFAIAAAALGGYREGGFKGAAKGGIGAYMGAKFSQGLAGGQGSLLKSGSAAQKFFGGAGNLAGRIPGVSQLGQGIGSIGQFAQGAGTGLRNLGQSVMGGTTPGQAATSSLPQGSPGILNPPSSLASSPLGPPSILNPASGAAQTVSNNPWYKDLAIKGFNALKTDIQNNPLKYGKAALEGYLAYAGQKEQNEQAEQAANYQITPTDMFTGRGTSPIYRDQYGSKDGGIIGLANGGEPAMEMDYRNGGFIPVGAYERADDVPARLSKNEFVMTADAVRAAGGGSIQRGSQKMYDLMNNLEARS